MMAHLPLRREALVSLKSVRRPDPRGLAVLEQMFAYFDYDDLPFIRQDDSTDYERAA